MTYWVLIYEFCKTGLFSIGGGLATLPFLYAMADRYPWFNRATLVDMIAISESTPGPIGINMATFAGFKAAGVAGGVTASLAIVLPSIFIIPFVARMMDAFKENKLVQNAFYGLRPVVTALIASAGIGVLLVTVLDWSKYPDVANTVNIKQLLLLAVLIAAGRMIKKIQPMHLIGAAAVMGILFKL